MFLPEEQIHLKNNIIIGTNNFQKSDLILFKSQMTKKSVCNLKYIDINDDLLQLREKYLREKIMQKKDKIGMISKDWLNKYQKEIPSVIIHIIDITYRTIDCNEPSLIAEEIIKQTGKIKGEFMSSNYILIIKNLYKSNLEPQIKSNILYNLKYVKDKCILIINDNNQFENKNFIDNLSEIVKDEINAFFYNKKNLIHRKYEQCNQKKEREFSIKYLIKLFALSYLTHIDNINYSYLFKANVCLKQKVDKNNYKFISYTKSNDNYNTELENKHILYQILTYFEIKNISDYVIYYLCMKKNMKEIEINKIVYNHLISFNINNFLKIDDNNNEEIKFYSKYLFIFDSLWKLSWYKFKEILINNKMKNQDENDSFKTNISFNKDASNFYILNNLLRLYDFMIKEKEFIENNILNKYKDFKYKKIENKFIEKIPSYFELDENDKEVKELNLKENILFYINKIILKNKDILDINIIHKKLENLFTNQKYNSYLFNLMIKFELINKISQQNKEIIIKRIVEYINDNKLIKFQKVYENYLEKAFNLFIKENIGDDIIDKKHKKKIIIKYLSNSKIKDFSSEENNLINNIINYKEDCEENCCFNLNNNNNFIDLKLIYNNNETGNNSHLLIKPFDCLNITLNLSIKRKDIYLDIEKIQIFFNSERNSIYNNILNNLINYKEINISKKISQNNQLSFNFNHLIKYTSYHYFFIHNVKIICSNGNIININNVKFNNDIILYNKKNLEQKIIEIFGNNEVNNKLKVAKKEYYFYSLQYQKVIDNDNIIISKILGNIELKQNEITEKLNEKETKEKNYYLKQINIDNNSDDNDNENTTIIYRQNKPISDRDIHKYNFLIKLNNEGKYCLFYNFKFTIIHKDCPDESYTFEECGQSLIECVAPFKFTTQLESPLYSIYGEDKKIFYINYPIKLNILITNDLNNKIIIKNINFENVSKSIKIYSPLLKIFSKKEKKIILSPEDKFMISNKLIFNENIEDYIGVIKIKWISSELNDFIHSKNLYNETILELNKIIVKDIFCQIEGKFIFDNNCLNNYLSYQLKIKNLNNSSKKIKCELFEEKNENNIIDDINTKEIVCFGKTIIKDIIMPQKELNIFFLFYIKNGHIDKNLNNIIDLKFKNIIKIDEYKFEVNKDKDAQSNLINRIIFIPELYSQLNKNN